MSDQDLARLYDELARFQWWRRRLGRASAESGLEMHKRLRAPRPGVDGPPAGAAGLDDWLMSRLSPPDEAHVLDIGCGFGATIFHCARRLERAVFVGLTLSQYQVRRAVQTAETLALSRRCEFRRQSFDDPIAGSFDVIVSVETLFHSRDLTRTLGNLARNLAPGGRLVLVEDMALVTGLEDDPGGRTLLECWSTMRFHGAGDYLSAMQAAGLEPVHEHDLSEQVPRAALAGLERRRRWLERLRRVLPGAAGRVIADAFVGGIALQELYARHRMSYRVMVARRAGE